MLTDLDVEAAEVCREIGIAMVRPSRQHASAFIDALADTVETRPVPTQYSAGPDAMTKKLLVGVLLVALSMAAAPAFAQPPIDMSPENFPTQFLRPGQKAKTGTGRLRGRVVAADTASIVRRAQVRVSSPDIGTRTAFTDAQGRYEFKDLPAGRFNLSVSKAGFVTMQYGQSRPFEPGRPIELDEAQVMEKADVALPRGSAVSGRILDEFGEPVADASVSAMRTQYSGGKRRLVQSGRPSTTNDLGQFRVFGLPPGDITSAPRSARSTR